MVTPQILKDARPYVEGFGFSFETGPATPNDDDYLETDPSPAFLAGSFSWDTDDHYTFRAKAAVRINGVWRVHDVRGQRTLRTDRIISLRGAHEYATEMAYPIDSRMEEKHIDGAYETYLNDDGDAWLFRHTRHGAHKDHELAVRGDVAGLINPLLLQYDVDARQAAQESARATANRRYVATAEFYGDWLGEAVKLARAILHGEMHRNPHDGHVFDVINAAYVATVKDWTDKNNPKLADINTTYLSGLLTIPEPTTVWDDAAAKAAAAAAASGSDC